MGKRSWWNRQLLTPSQYKTFRGYLRPAYGRAANLFGLPKGVGEKGFDLAERGLRYAFPVRTREDVIPYPVRRSTGRPGGKPLMLNSVQLQKSAPSSRRSSTSSSSYYRSLSSYTPRSSLVRHRRKFRAVGKSRYVHAHKGKKRRRLSKLRFKGVKIVEDTTQKVDDPRTVYFGHYTHPHHAVINSIGLALAKYIGRVCAGHVPSTMEEVIGGTYTSNANEQLHVDLLYRERKIGSVEADTVTQASTITVTAGMTYLAFGNLIVDKLYDIFGDKAFTAGTPDVQTTMFKRTLESINCRPYDNNTGAAAYVRFKPAHFKASDMKVAVKGCSILKYQNTTLSAETGGSTDVHHVNNNPVEGKIYEGKGSMFNLVNYNLTAGGSEGNLVVDSRYGFGDFGADDFTDPAIDNILEHPPNHRQWKGLSSSRYVRMQPGTISSSLIKKTHLLSLNQWLTSLRAAFVPQTTDPGDATGPDIGLSPAKSVATGIGRSRWIALDKMIHDDDDGDTIIQTECHIEVTACVFHKKKSQVTAAYPLIRNA